MDIFLNIRHTDRFRDFWTSKNFTSGYYKIQKYSFHYHTSESYKELTALN